MGTPRGGGRKRSQRGTLRLSHSGRGPSRCSGRSLVDDGWGQLLHRRRCQEYLSGGHPFPPPLPLYLETSVFSPSPCTSFSSRAALSSPFHPLCQPTNAFSFRVARCILLLLLLLLAEFVNASHNRVRIITYLYVSESRKENCSTLLAKRAIPELYNNKFEESL